MRIITKTLIATSAALAFGCGPRHSSPPPNNGQNNGPAPQQEVRPQVDDGILPSAPQPWSLKIQSDCPQDKKDTCIGAYGFSVNSKGEFKVGPGPDGQIVDGELSSDEVKNISVQLLEAGTGGPETCVPNTEEPSTDSSIEVNQERGSKFKIRFVKNELCYSSLKPEEALKLSKEAQKIMKKYHPDRFPNECINAAQSLQKFYDTIKECEKDYECSYLDDDFLPLASEQIENFTIDDCTFIKPLITANSFSAVTNQLKLLTMRHLAKEVCAKEPKRKSCDEPKKLKPIKMAPLCVKGRCSVHPFLKAK
jgi:hypothetical protein